MSKSPHPNRIKRIGVAIEFEDGTTTMMFSDDQETEVVLETKTDHPEWDPYGRHRLHSPKVTRTLTIEGLRTMTFGKGRNETVAQHVTSIRKSLEG